MTQTAFLALTRSNQPQRLGLPVVTYVQKVRELKENSVIVERQLEDGYEVVEVPTPAVLTCVKELNEPRYMTVAGILHACEDSPITVWDENDVELAPEQCGLSASPTQVMKSFTPPPKGKGEMLSGTAQKMAATLVDRLKEKHAI